MNLFKLASSRFMVFAKSNSPKDTTIKRNIIIISTVVGVVAYQVHSFDQKYFAFKSTEKDCKQLLESTNST